MRYDVNVYRDGQLIMSTPDCTERQVAKFAAKDAGEYPDCLIFVEFFRASDGQHGYLNQDEGHAITGKAWRSEISSAAAAMGRKGGAAKSDRKIAASRENGRKGGRPPKKEIQKSKIIKSKPPSAGI